MPRYKATIAYDGTNFCGFQRQMNGRTVQEEMEKTLCKLTNGQPIKVFGSGRTDSGVHAWGQVIHFDYPEKKDVERLRFALDTQTPTDIAVRKLEEVSEQFHARYQVVRKTYQFRVDIGKPRNPFKRYYASYYPYPLNIAAIQQAITDFEGTHDFTAFCASGSPIENKVRTIYSAKVAYVESEQELIFTFCGNGFLYKMVRIMVGTLLKIGNERLACASIPIILSKKDRHLAGPTAHPEGLYLLDVQYGDGELNTMR